MKSKHIENLTRFLWCEEVYKLQEGPYKGSLCLVSVDQDSDTLLQFEPLDGCSGAWNVSVFDEPKFGMLFQTGKNSVWEFTYGSTRQRITLAPCSTGIEAIIQVCKMVLSGIIYVEGVS